MEDYGHSRVIKTMRLVAIILITLGLLVGVGGFLAVRIASANSSATLALPVVIESISRDKAYVTYEFNGKIYKDIPLSNYSSTWKEGQSFLVKIDPEKPSKPQSYNTLAFTLIPVFIGVIFLIIGICFFIVFSVLSKIESSF